MARRKMAQRVVSRYLESNYANEPVSRILLTYKYTPVAGDIPRTATREFPDDAASAKQFKGNDAHKIWIRNFTEERIKPLWMQAVKITPGKDGGPPKETILMEWDQLYGRII